MKCNKKEMLKDIWFQLRAKDAIKNIFITHNAFGIFSINSHINGHNNQGTPKQTFPDEKTAQKVAEILSKKYNANFSAYKCGFCSGYHIGKDSK